MRYHSTGKAARVFEEFNYRTRKSWSWERRVIGKAEHLSKGANPRFVVTTLTVEQAGAQYLYETLYCARGEMENRIKEQQLDLFADRTSSQAMRANQLRLYFASFAYVHPSPNPSPTAKRTFLPTPLRACDFCRTELGIGQRITTFLYTI